MIEQQADELIVVDFNCPDRTGDWIESNFPRIRCIRSGDEGPFSASKARNLGAASATGDWLCFVDADIVLAPDFLKIARGHIAQHNFFRPAPASGLWNPILCRRQAWIEVGGFDEVITGWGCEDDDFFRRLELQGAVQHWFPESMVDELAYDKALRSRFHELDHAISHRVNALYVQIKLDLTRLMSGEIDLPTRETLYREAYRAVTTNADSAQIRATLPASGDLPIATCWNMERQLMVTLRWQQPIDRAA